MQSITLVGDERYAHAYQRIQDGADKSRTIHELSDDEVIHALAHASRERDPYLANVIATEALNRMRRARVSLNHVGAGIVVVDHDERIADLNPMAERLLSCDKAQCIGRDRHDTFHCRDANGTTIPKESCPISHVLRSGEVVDVEVDTFTRADGTLLQVAYTASPIRNAGTIEGAVIAFHDITARQDANREREDWLGLLSAMYAVHDRLGIGLLIVDGARIQFANDAFRELVGRSLEELRQDEHLIDLVEEHDREEFQRHLAAIVFDQAPNAPRRARLVHRDGHVVPAEVLVSKVDRPGSDEPPRIVCLIRRVQDN